MLRERPAPLRAIGSELRRRMRRAGLEVLRLDDFVSAEGEANLLAALRAVNPIANARA
jgi:hypothetical protein